MVAAPVPDQHPLLAAVATAQGALADVRDVPATFLSTGDKRQALLEVTALEAQVAALKARLVAPADVLAEEDGARDVATWVSHHTRADLRATRPEVELAQALDRRWTRVAAGMTDGTVSPAQAKVVVEALDALPDTVDAEVRAKAETQLVAWCTQFKPHELRLLGKRILTYLDPDAADAEDARRLQHEEQNARDKMRLTFKPQGDGTTRLSGLLPDPAAARLKTYLEAFTSPRNPNGTPPGAGEADRIPYPRRLAHAFCSLLEHLDPTTLPDHGGDATTVIVTIGLDQLRSELATASILDGSDPALGPNLSAAEARRLACTAGIIPAVLGTNGEVLDLGRTERLYRPPQRKALRLRDRRCRVKGCDAPATWCEAHHLTPWSEGGKTDLDNAVLICSWHHHRIHDPRYEHQRLPDGDLLIRRRRPSRT
ncbi:MAG TPA: DUF222 domain-containing protein [Nocardioides sp.]|nr:DUF222 domain-containing protein [Nocardioides sp.]